jgi:N-acetylglucosaminyldiphosphoundecaprenol N-acetyl-beta-D-mannosaminyltransferase
MVGKFQIFGVKFSTLPRIELRESIIKCANENHGTSVVFANAHVVVESSRSQHLLNVISKADFVVPDGVPIAWVLKAKGQTQAQRYSGPDFMEDVFRDTPRRKHFFLGSTPDILDKIKLRFKGKSEAAGFYSPPFSKEFSEEEKSKQLRLIENAGADFVWVGLGAPKQEKYVVEMASRASRGVWLAVGAAFDFYAGTKPRAPKALQSVGLEWAFRMATEPKRLTKRYLLTNPAFIKLAVNEVLKRSKPR